MTGRNPQRWDNVYPEYKGQRFSVWNEEPTGFFLEKADYLKKHGVKKVLDAGCGDGRNLLAFAEQGFDVVGVDSSEEGIRRAHRVSREYPNAEAVQGDLRELNYKDEFDAVICDYVMVHLEDAGKVLRNLFDSLKPGGFLLVEFHSTDDPAFGKGEKVGHNAFMEGGVYYGFHSVEEVKRMLKGFEILETRKMERWDPDLEMDGYPHAKRHKHDSIFVFAKKPGMLAK